MLPRIQSDIDRLKRQIELAKNFDTEDWAKSLISQHICICISGALENAIKLILSEYARRAGNNKMARVVSAYCEKFTNPKSEKICQLLGSFEPAWRTHYEKNITEKDREIIDSIVNNRNNIAHGRPTGVSLLSVINFFSSFERVLKCIDALVLGAK